MIKRSDIPTEDRWSISKIYSDDEQIEADIKVAIAYCEEFCRLETRLGEGAGTLLKALELLGKYSQKIEKVYVYAKMKRDEDNTKSQYQALEDRIVNILTESEAKMAWFTPEILSLSYETIDTYYKQEPGLLSYKHYLNEILREKEHTLSVKEERLLASFSEVIHSSRNIFKMLHDADMEFKGFVSEGKEQALTNSNFTTFMQSSDEYIRNVAYKNLYAGYKSLANTLASTYSSKVKASVAMARARNYPSSLEMHLSPDNVSKEVYTNLINSVRSNLDSMHKYMGLRKRLLNINELKMTDIYVPLFMDVEKEYLQKTGINLMTEALTVFGDEYIENVTQGINEGWIDWFENDGKTSGAYSFGAYDTHPYILLNYHNKLDDVFTLVHEMGHSMHSYYTRKNQPYVYGGHSIFTAEVASTVNECLLIEHLRKKEKDDEFMQKYLINMHIEEFRTTLFRQTMFAEFELIVHEAVENGVALTSEWLCNEYKKLLEIYHGEDMVLDDEIVYEWARIPHFYSPFYVYKYATGYSAATAIAAGILKKGDSAVGKYLEFLKSGDSDSPISLLKLAGVDMSSPKPINDAMAVFRSLVDELDILTCQTGPM